MASRQYLPRIVDDQVSGDLAAIGAVVLEGPRACGKTETARQHAASEVRLDVDHEAFELARIDPALVLDGETPRLIDEWQLEPTLWNAVRRAVDDRRMPGQFLLTGSARPPQDARRHSGAGRMARIRMRPMTLWESGESTGEVSLKALFAGEVTRGHSQMSLAEYAVALARGGWPDLVTASHDNTERFVRSYLDYAIEHVVPTAQGSHRDPLRFERFLRAYAQFSAQQAPLTRIISRVVGEDAPPSGRDATLTWHTADAYHDAAAQLMLLADLPSWNPQLRSRTRLASLRKRHFIDPSLPAALLGVNAAGLLKQPQTLGFLFESLAVRDLSVYAQALDADLFHYRERNGDLEVDIVIERQDGSWIGVEVKLGSYALDEGAAALLKLAEHRVRRPPEALMIVTTGKYAYRRSDGVSVVPLGALSM